MTPSASICDEKKLLIEIYAVRSREFSDAVAQLGRRSAQTGQSFLEAIEESERLHALCDSACAQLHKHVADHGC
jgi:hypothetical protein